MNDYAMVFEEVVVAYLGNPKTATYYANYYGDDFKTKALLFVICTREVNNSGDNYTKKEVKMLEDFGEKLSKNDTKFTEIQKCIEFLSKKK